MPLSMTINRSHNTPLVTPCFDGKELHVDSDLVSAGLSAISIKGCDAGDPSEDGIKHRNSFWSVHRPELSKLSWASNYTPQNLEHYLKVQSGNLHPDEEFNQPDVPLADFNKLTVIHANLNHREDIDDHYSFMSKPQTTQFSDDESHTTLHKSRAEFCVTIGHAAEQFISESSEHFCSKIVQENSDENNLLHENNAAKSMGLQMRDEKIETVYPPAQIAPAKMPQNENLTALSGLYDKPYEIFDKRQTDGRLQNTSRELLITLMDDVTKDRQAY